MAFPSNPSENDTHVEFGKTYTFDGVKWKTSAVATEAGAKADIFWENGTTIASDYTITDSKNAGTFGPVTVDTGVTVTVPTGSRWVVV